jgi:hypothetical protein
LRFVSATRAEHGKAYDIERLRGQPRAPGRLRERERATDESILRGALDENKRVA